MTTHGITSSSAGPARKSVDRSAAVSGAGSIVLVLLVAGILVAAAAVFMLLRHGSAEPYILVFLAVLATVGVFSLFALAAGIDVYKRQGHVTGS